MGQTTYNSGQVNLSRPLTLTERELVKQFTRATHENGIPNQEHARYTAWRLEDHQTLVCGESSGDREVDFLKVMIDKFFAPWGVFANGRVDCEDSWDSENRWYFTCEDNVVTVGTATLLDTDEFKRLQFFHDKLKEADPALFESINKQWGR